LAYETEQKYKEGKFVLEKACMGKVFDEFNTIFSFDGSAGVECKDRQPYQQHQQHTQRLVVTDS
jgi:hypothetical protein